MNNKKDTRVYSVNIGDFGESLLKAFTINDLHDTRCLMTDGDFGANFYQGTACIGLRMLCNQLVLAI
jgi:hypothetical protein